MLLKLVGMKLVMLPLKFQPNLALNVVLLLKEMAVVCIWFAHELVVASNGVGFAKLNGLGTVWVLTGSVKFVHFVIFNYCKYY